MSCRGASSFDEEVNPDRDGRKGDHKQPEPAISFSPRCRRRCGCNRLILSVGQSRYQKKGEAELKTLHIGFSHQVMGEKG